MDFDECPTMSATQTSGLGAMAELSPALTILWHPDLSRVGAMFSFAEVAVGREIGLSRLTPTFPFFSNTPGTLGDPFLSRQPIVQFTRTVRGLKLTPYGSHGSVSVDGMLLESERILDLEDPNGSHILCLSRRVVLCIHLASIHDAIPTFDLGLLGNSDVMAELRRSIRAVAKLPYPVLIRGESGSGKELTASGIVRESRRHGKPYLVVNMASVPSATAVAEIFGYERGAFTGATDSRRGYFVEADGGSLFLDEIGLATIDVQTALLRVVETGEVRPLGSSRYRKTDVRVLAATDAPLENLVDAGTFSEALFHRLAAFKIVLPPLRHRRQDIGSLFLHFLTEALTQTGELSKLDCPTGEKRPWLSGDGMAKIAKARWSGNVRELRNFATQLAVSNRGVDRAHFDSAMLGELVYVRDKVEEVAGRSQRTIKPADISQDEIRRTLEKCNYGTGKAARALGVSKTTLYKLLDRDPSFRKAADLSDEEIVELRNRFKGDYAAMAKHLSMSERSLKLRITKLS